MAVLLCMAATAVNAEPVEVQAGPTHVRLEFYTPQTVRVTKAPVGHQKYPENADPFKDPEKDSFIA